MKYKILLLIFILLAGVGIMMELSSEDQSFVEFEVEGVITKIELQHDVTVDDIKVNGVIFVNGKPINNNLTMPNGIGIIEETNIYKINDSEIRESIELNDLKIGDYVHCWIAMKYNNLTSASQIYVK